MIIHLRFTHTHTLARFLSLYLPLNHSLIRSSLVPFFHFTLFTTFLCFMLIVFFDCLPLFLRVFVFVCMTSTNISLFTSCDFPFLSPRHRHHAIVVVFLLPALLSGFVRLVVYAANDFFSFIFIFRFSAVDIIVHKPTDGI